MPTLGRARTVLARGPRFRPRTHGARSSPGLSLSPRTPWPRNGAAPLRLPLCKASDRGLKRKTGVSFEPSRFGYSVVKALRAVAACVSLSEGSGRESHARSPTREGGGGASRVGIGSVAVMRTSTGAVRRGFRAPWRQNWAFPGPAARAGPLPRVYLAPAWILGLRPSERLLNHCDPLALPALLRPQRAACTCACGLVKGSSCYRSRIRGLDVYLPRPGFRGESHAERLKRTGGGCLRWASASESAYATRSALARVGMS